MNDSAYWQIEHNGHLAWYQRALISGDFKPGLTPQATYIVDADGRYVDPATTPTCATCGEVPDVDDLDAVERVTGRRDFLDGYRSGLDPWPAPTDPAKCRLCNCGPAGDAGLCPTCAAHIELEVR